MGLLKGRLARASTVSAPFTTVYNRASIQTAEKTVHICQPEGLAGQYHRAAMVVVAGGPSKHAGGRPQEGRRPA